LTFSIYGGGVSGRELSRYFFQRILLSSWSGAFSLLSEKVQESSLPAAPTPEQIADFAGRHRMTFLASGLRSFDDVDIQRRGVIDFEGFARWASTNRTISASCGSVSVYMPLTINEVFRLVIGSLKFNSASADLSPQTRT